MKDISSKQLRIDFLDEMQERNDLIKMKLEAANTPEELAALRAMSEAYLEAVNTLGHCIKYQTTEGLVPLA